MISPFFPRNERATPDPTLECLGGRSASKELIADLKKLAALPADARLHFWEVLEPCLGEQNPPDLAERVRRFCDKYQVRADGFLGDAVGAARCLVRGASVNDLSRSAFADDLSRLPEDLGLEVILMTGYEAGKALVRGEIAQGAIGDHGARFEKLDWRLDTIVSSSRWSQVATPVAMLTIHYGKGKRRRTVTLQATLDDVLDIERACARIREDAKGAREGAAPAKESAQERPR